MREQHIRGLRIGATVAAVILAGAVSTSAAEPGEEPQTGHPAMGDSAHMEQGKMEMHQQMHAKMEAMNSRLDDLVAEMNAAEGDQKTEAVAAVVNELVAQRSAMHTRMMASQPRMKCRMMEGSMGDCPMKGMSSSAEEVEVEEHSEHHADG